MLTAMAVVLMASAFDWWPNLGIVQFVFTEISIFSLTALAAFLAIVITVWIFWSNRYVSLIENCETALHAETSWYHTWGLSKVNPIELDTGFSKLLEACKKYKNDITPKEAETVDLIFESGINTIEQRVNKWVKTVKSKRTKKESETNTNDVTKLKANILEYTIIVEHKNNIIRIYRSKWESRVYKLLLDNIKLPFYTILSMLLMVFLLFIAGVVSSAGDTSLIMTDNDRFYYTIMLGLIVLFVASIITNFFLLHTVNK
jgi:hypothetical protein